MPRTSLFVRPIPALSAVLVICGAAAVLTPTAAHANAYTVPYCQAGHPMSEDWSVVNNYGSGSDSVYDRCSDGSDVPVIDWTQPAHRRSGAISGWTLQVKSPELSISRWEASASAVVQSNMTNAILAGVPNGYLLCGAGNCSQSYGGDTGNTLSSGTLTWSMQCDAQAASLPSCDGTASTRLFTNRVTFLDADGPTGTVEGSLLSSSGDNPASGSQQTVAVAVTDRGSGVQYEEAFVDGRSTDRTLSRCLEPFARMQPCPGTGSSKLAIDTTKFTDGAHTLSVVAADASGGSRTLWQGTIVIQNGSQVGPGSDTALRGAPNGAPASDDAKVQAWWPATAHPASKRRDIVRRCKRSKTFNRRHQRLCVGTPARGVITKRYAGKGGTRLAGRLLDAAGAPVAGAAIQFVRAPRAAGVAPVSLGGTTTGPDGRWETKVPIAAGSASVQIQYRTHARDTVTRLGSAAIRVQARTSINTPAKAVRRGRTARFSGTLLGRNGRSLAGVPIALQANAGRRWGALATVTSNEKGRWHFNYRVPRSLLGRYRVRALIKTTGTYPYAPGRSRTSSFRVR